jgi:ubiquinone biosynthesis protein Coq4
MSDSSVATPDLAPNLQRFFSSVDRVAELLGLNVSQIVEIEKLRSLPVGTLGRTLTDFFETHQLTPLTTGPRRKQLHDVVHVLTGYRPDSIGEAEVQAFLLGSKFRLVHILLGLGLLGLIHKHKKTIFKSYPPHLMWERLWCAYQRGCNSQFDIDTWQPELQWELPLTQVQALLHV